MRLCPAALLPLLLGAGCIPDPNIHVPDFSVPYQPLPDLSAPPPPPPADMGARGDMPAAGDMGAAGDMPAAGDMGTTPDMGGMGNADMH